MFASVRSPFFPFRKDRATSAKARPTFKPQVECLEERNLMSSFAVLNALSANSYWVTYAPSTLPPNGSKPVPFYPTYDGSGDLTDAQITTDLQKLHQEGFSGLVTYDLLGTLKDVPMLAKSVGFQWVIAGIYHVNPTDPGYGQDLANATSSAVAKYVDAYVVGNEGMFRALNYPSDPTDYTLKNLLDEMAALKSGLAGLGLPQTWAITTTETSEAYLPGSPLFNNIQGQFSADFPGDPVPVNGVLNADATVDAHLPFDWTFPNDNFFNNFNTVAAAWRDAENNYFGIVKYSLPGRVVVAKESQWPSAGGAFASEQNQLLYYQMLVNNTVLANTHMLFVWGAAYDQVWNTSARRRHITG